MIIFPFSYKIAQYNFTTAIISKTAEPVPLFPDDPRAGNVDHGTRHIYAPGLNFYYTSLMTYNYYAN